MKLGWRRTIGVVIITAAMCLLGVAPASGQAPQQKSEEAFKNVQILKGISVNEFMDTMGFMSASLSFNCSDCHEIGRAHV